MTFEEFFSKKRIDLSALQKAEPALFSEFRTHYEQMGEKSFDHTKKYWFNKLRLQYHLAPEPKVEKVTIEKPAAQQTITQTLSETTAPPAKVGFTPRFKAGMTKPAEPATSTPETKASETEKPAEAPAAATPKPGFTPRFKAGVTKPAEPKEETAAPETKTPDETPATPAPKIGFTPRFKAGVTKLATPATEVKEEPKAEAAPETPADEKPAEDAPKPAYKPRFNMKNMKPKDGDE